MNMKITMVFLLAITIFSQPSLYADDDKDSSNEKGRKYHKIKRAKLLKGAAFQYLESQFVSKEEFSKLNQAIDDLNKSVEAMETKLANIPPDIALSLADLEKAVEDNTSDMSLVLGDVERILIEIESVLSRISELEQSISIPPISENIVFSGHFIRGVVPSNASELGLSWIDFKNNANGLFSGVEISGSFGKGVSCSDPDTATAIANGLNSYVLGAPTETFNCENRVWNVGTCGNGVELNAGSLEGACNCNQEASVRPLTNNANWGGIGITCGAPSQTLEVILTR